MAGRFRITLRSSLPVLLSALIAAANQLPATSRGQIAPPTEPAASLRVLTTTRDVRALSAEEARRRHPVKIHAMVTGFLLRGNAGYFVADESGPIFVHRDRHVPPELEVGQILELEGVSDPGVYAPQIHELHRRVVGRGELPPPCRPTFEEIASGQQDCEFAEISGIVRGTTPLGFTLAMGNSIVDVGCSAYSPEELERFVDARVRLRGIVSGRFNQKRQWVSVRFTVSRRNDLIVERAAPANPFSVPSRSIGELLQWELNQAGPHRVKVRGVVTHFQPGVALFIRESNTGLRVRTTQTDLLAPGDVVEVLGFPAMGTYSAVLDDAVFRRVDAGPAASPRPATAEQLLSGEDDGDLVAVRGVLLEAVRQYGAHVLVMQDRDIIFHAQIEDDPADESALPAPGSVLELTGICVVAATNVHGARLTPRMFSLLLRSPDDIHIVREPSWWTVRRLWQAIATISIIALGILSWVWLLRRQVQAQTMKLKDQTQREAVLEERTRIAQELHDTLDQELTGIGLQLNAAVAQLKEEPLGERLQLVHRLVQRSQSEVRRSIWDLRQPALESGGIVAALERTAAQLREGSTASLEVRVHGATRALPALVEHHLVRIATEAMPNAFRHATATRIEVELFYEPAATRLRISDNGRGFVADQAPNYTVGHFGLIGMRERCRKIGAVLNLESHPGAGTRIEVRLEHHGENGSWPVTRRPESFASA